MQITDFLRSKGATVVTINPDATVWEWITVLAEQNVWCHDGGRHGGCGPYWCRSVTSYVSFILMASACCLTRAPRS